MVRLLVIKKHPSLGFTLIEIIVVITVLSILAVGATRFITNTAEGYASAARRQQISTTGRIAIEKISREIRNALPNSVRVSVAAGNGDQCIEFVPIVAASTYLSVPIATAVNTFQSVEFASGQGSVTGQVVVYSLSTVDVYYDGSGTVTSPGHISESVSLSAAVSGVVTVTMSSVHRFIAESPTSRFFIVNEPVSYCLVSGLLYRYENYQFHNAQPTPIDTPPKMPTDTIPTATVVGPVVSNLINNTGLTAFTVTPATLTRNSIIDMDINFTDAGESVRINHEAQIRNVP